MELANVWEKSRRSRVQQPNFYCFIIFMHDWKPKFLKISHISYFSAQKRQNLKKSSKLHCICHWCSTFEHWNWSTEDIGKVFFALMWAKVDYFGGLTAEMLLVLVSFIRLQYHVTNLFISELCGTVTSRVNSSIFRNVQIQRKQNISDQISCCQPKCVDQNSGGKATPQKQTHELLIFCRSVFFFFLLILPHIS